MKKLSSNDIRKMWFDFFISKKHHLVASASLIPFEDSSLLWVNAGITPLKKYFDGTHQTPFTRIVNSQKCLRTNDIENIGKTHRHHTFFEMLGNFSIGDYFKKEAIDLAYELLISKDWFAFSQDKLYITYFSQDIETYNLWLQKGIKAEHLIPLETNFWEIGEGPCGPCTEIFYDRGNTFDTRSLELIREDIDNNRFVEIWNIVFSQYNASKNIPRIQYPELKNKNIDTGAGLARLACISQNTETNFETDLFLPIIKHISILSCCPYQGQESFKLIADHLKSLVFGISDGAAFANDGRGYVLKKLLRRALQQGQNLFLKQAFLFKLVPTVVNIYRLYFSDLAAREKFIIDIIKTEEQKFLATLAIGKKYLKKLSPNNLLSSENFFKLYDTYGLPKEIILEYAKKYHIQIEQDQFDNLLFQQKRLSHWREQRLESKMQKQNDLFFDFKDDSFFVGYDILTIKTKIIKIFKEGVVLAKTPFYPTMGGQVSDIGFIDNIPVKQVIQLPHGQHLHKVPKSSIFVEGQEIIAFIDIKHRENVSLHHTATHLLGDALKFLFGTHIKQNGSYIDSNLLRFDFNHFSSLSETELIQLENQINQWIQANYTVYVQEMSFEEAKKIKATYLDNAYYPEKVRVVKIGSVSLQICGGTHAINTKCLKRCALLSYRLIGSGVYRIEAVVGDNIAFSLKQKIQVFKTEEKNIKQKINQLIQNVPHDIRDKQLFNQFIATTTDRPQSFQDIQNYKKYLHYLSRYLEQINKDLYKYQVKTTLQKADLFLSQIKNKQSLIVIPENMATVETLKPLLEYLFDKSKSEFLCLCYAINNKFVFLCKSNFIHIGNFIKKINNIIGTKGGGNLFFGQGSGVSVEKMHQFIQKWKSCL